MYAVNSGGEANNSGSFLEEVVEREAKARGFHIADYSYVGDHHDLLNPNVLIRNVPFRSAYGCASRSEFVIRCRIGQRDIRIECKWQQKDGSVDEKFPYMLLNAEKYQPESEIVLLIDGGGARPEAVAWLKKAAKRVSTKKIHVFTVTEYRQWFQKLCNGNA